MKKKLFSLISLGFLCLAGLTACGTEEASAPSADQSDAQTEALTPVTLNEGSPFYLLCSSVRGH